MEIKTLTPKRLRNTVEEIEVGETIQIELVDFKPSAVQTALKRCRRRTGRILKSSAMPSSNSIMVTRLE